MSHERAAKLSRRSFITRSAATGFTVMAGGGLLAACGSSSESSPSGGGAGNPGGKLKGPIAYQGPLTAWVIGDQLEAAAGAVSQQLGLELKKVNYNGDSDKQLAQIDQLGTLGVTGINTLILDGGLARQLATACVRNRTYLSSWATMGPWVVPCEPEIAFHYQGLANPADGAYVMCVNMFEEMGGRGTFAHLSGSGGVSTSPAKDKAVDRALKQYPGIELVAREYGEYNREKSRQVMTNILSKTGGRVDAVYCQSDDEAVGALDALRERNLVGKTLVAGADGIPEFIDAIIDGRAFGTEGAAPIFGGGYTLVQALDASAGHRPKPTETLMYQDLLIIDNKASATAFKQQALAKGAAGRLFDYGLMSRIEHPDDWDPQWPLRTFDPEEYWGVAQGVAKPNGYELPEEYTRAAAAGQRREVDAEYAQQLRRFALAEVARLSRTRKTLFEQLDAAAGA
ncbi:sugar ABC transporter substrate-binding protein [Conexibacter sp. CPCC 206217]|uniref:sugar ABC transporter substrate-binding protein n=1 Tax=Conexibacter sp. CPCC 206217 TaxID=3064574 RepID=UPI00272008FC|nr:sugar ABC transporter substrate-binding protein [Conexibacter sp. CPCC 206217]MDO8212289.1 sugar ABC transporter substrate-binding protein [Conexibacter sp. CPCC 206217]